MVEFNNQIRNLDSSLKEKSDQLLLIEAHRDNLKMELNDYKITTELEINDFKFKVKKYFFFSLIKNVLKYFFSQIKNLI